MIRNWRYRLAFVWVLAWAATGPAWPHDFWKNNHIVDPQTKQWCCSDADTKEIDASLVGIVKGGFYLRDTGEFIANDRVQASPDGSIWVSRWGDPKTTKCFFYPSNG
jgi:hypothetical protein